MRKRESEIWTGAISSSMQLSDGSRIAVIGGGPAGSFFSYFALDMAQRVRLEIELDIFEPRDFSQKAPQGCNMCAGTISESLVQYLAAEGINLPPTVVQRGIDSYMMHMDVGQARIDTPRHEKRIAAVHRGGGPRTIKERKWDSFDGYLLSLASEKGAQVYRERIKTIDWQDDRPQIIRKNGEIKAYDLVVLATGVNTPTFKHLEKVIPDYRAAGTTKTALREYYLGLDTISDYLGDSFHVFLLDIPRLDFAAIIPKGDFATVCLLGESIDNELLSGFLDDMEVRSCFPPEWDPQQLACNCGPRINTQPATHPYGDRVVFIGDCGVSRLYKDGIGAAYRTAKAAASTVVFQGISEEDFEQNFWPACRTIARDNNIGRIIFWVVRLIQRMRFTRRGLLRMVRAEQARANGDQPMSNVLWDTFTGSAPYTDVFLRAMHPRFLGSFTWHIAAALFQRT